MSSNNESNAKSQKQYHFESFTNWLATLEEAGSTSKIVDRQRAEVVMAYLLNPDVEIDDNFKYHIKKVNYNITFDSKGNPILSRLVGNENLPVAIKEDFFDILYKTHVEEMSHAGILKIEKLISTRYYGIFILTFLSILVFRYLF